MFYVWDERQFAVKDNAQELSFLYDRNGGTVPAASISREFFSWGKTSDMPVFPVA